MPLECTMMILIYILTCANSGRDASGISTVLCICSSSLKNESSMSGCKQSHKPKTKCLVAEAHPNTLPAPAVHSQGVADPSAVVPTTA